MERKKADHPGNIAASTKHLVGHS